MGLDWGSVPDWIAASAIVAAAGTWAWHKRKAIGVWWASQMSQADHVESRTEADELAVLVPLYQAQLAAYQADKEGATKLVSYGDSKRNETLEVSELAAWTMMDNLVMNLDESVTKE